MNKVFFMPSSPIGPARRHHKSVFTDAGTGSNTYASTLLKNGINPEAGTRNQSPRPVTTDSEVTSQRGILTRPPLHFYSAVAVVSL
jgi:hypothetical protein